MYLCTYLVKYLLTILLISFVTYLCTYLRITYVLYVINVDSAHQKSCQYKNILFFFLYLLIFLKFQSFGINLRYLSTMHGKLYPANLALELWSNKLRCWHGIIFLQLMNHYNHHAAKYGSRNLSSSELVLSSSFHHAIVFDSCPFFDVIYPDCSWSSLSIRTYIFSL